MDMTATALRLCDEYDAFSPETAALLRALDVEIAGADRAVQSAERLLTTSGRDLSDLTADRAALLREARARTFVASNPSDADLTDRLCVVDPPQCLVDEVTRRTTAIDARLTDPARHGTEGLSVTVEITSTTDVASLAAAVRDFASRFDPSPYRALAIAVTPSGRYDVHFDRDGHQAALAYPGRGSALATGPLASMLRLASTRTTD